VGNGPRPKRSISADLIFCYFLIKQNGEALLSALKKQTRAKKVKEPPRQLSGVNTI